MKNGPTTQSSETVKDMQLNGSTKLRFSAIHQTIQTLEKSDSKEAHSTKIYRVFIALIQGWTGNRFKAEKDLNDHCLNSTVCSIQNKFGITISRGRETVRGYRGAKTSVMRYWLSTEDLLEYLEGKNHE